MKDVVVTMLSKLNGNGIIIALSLTLGASLCALGIACHNGYDLNIGTNGISCKKSCLSN